MLGSHQSVFIYSLEEGAAVCRYVTPIDCLLLGRAHVSVIFCCDETPRPKHFLKEESVLDSHSQSMFTACRGRNSSRQEPGGRR